MVPLNLHFFKKYIIINKYLEVPEIENLNAKTLRFKLSYETSQIKKFYRFV